jgi:hypothetical protein
MVVRVCVDSEQYFALVLIISKTDLLHIKNMASMIVSTMKKAEREMGREGERGGELARIHLFGRIQYLFESHNHTSVVDVLSV